MPNRGSRLNLASTLLVVLSLSFSATAPAQSTSFTSTESVGSESREDDLPAIAASPDGSLWAAWLSYRGRRDEIGMRHYANGKWSNLQWVPGTSGDAWLPQIAVDTQNRPWVVWSEQRDENWDLYARSFDPASQSWGPLVRLTDNPLPDINPRLAIDGKGRFALVWQGFRHKHSNIYLKTFEAGTWSEEIQITGRPANDWEPAAAFDSAGRIWVAYDSYKSGNYDVFLSGVDNGRVTVPEIAVSATPLSERRATVAVDNDDRVWVAWEEGGANWGKDTGYTIGDTQPGVRLGADRDVNIACYANGRLRTTAQRLNDTFASEPGDPKWVYQPHVFADGKGAIWVVAKRRINASQENANRGYWEYWLTRYDGGRWRRAEPVPNSWGRSSTRVNFANAADGRMWIAWPTDNRPAAQTHRPLRDQIYVGVLPNPAPAPPPTLVDPPLRKIGVPPGHPNEAADLDAIRGYRTNVAGRPVQIVRGDFHRHTELSWDGGGGADGSLQDFYRYMIDAAEMDFGASTDHQGGAFEYWWWYTQKMSDMYHLPGKYVPIYGFERSVTQPFGHRNIFYAERSGRVVPFFMKTGVNPFELPLNPIGEEPPVGTPAVVDNDTYLLYEEIRRMGGIAISHTSGTRMGTAWRDVVDPELEPVVEIFQGARTNYEYVGAPLSAAAGKDDAHMARAGYFPEGFVRNAWEKGYRLGIVTSSDHSSTHYSYAMVYTPRPTRQGILDAIRRRHTYGATDNIILDVRMGDHFMGEEFRVEGALPIRVKIRGTVPVKLVEIIRGAQILYANEPGAQEVSFDYTDNNLKPGPEARYYYVRVQQQDGNIAWSSPMWVNYQ